MVYKDSLVAVHSAETCLVGRSTQSMSVCSDSVQVWGISCVDRAVYFRQGVTSSELSGKAWKVVNVPRDGDIRSHSSASISSLHRWAGDMDTEYCDTFPMLGQSHLHKTISQTVCRLGALCITNISLSPRPTVLVVSSVMRSKPSL